jgi:hypothetical protein
MALAAALMLWAGRQTSFFSDELQYLARGDELGNSGPLNLTYALHPFNGHLQLVGKAFYELFFAVAGTDYFWFRLAEVVAYLTCVGLFFALARTRVGNWAGTAASVVLLFLGAGWEVMLWPFDIHTLLALAAGLAAILVLERRERRWTDPLACVLLCLAIASIEIGFAFAVGITVGFLLQPARRSRVWVSAVPLVLYAVWSLWARQFNDSQVDLTYLAAIATSVPASLAASAAAITGLVDTTQGANPNLAAGLGPELVIAIAAFVAFVWRISTAPVPVSTWVFVTTLLTYWLMITLAHRAPDTSRYLLVDATLVLLIGADLVGPVRVAGRWLIACAAVMVLALPLNLFKLFDGRAELVRETQLSQAQYAALELVRGRVDPQFRPSQAQLPLTAGVTPTFGLQAASYFKVADRVGSLAMPLNELREAPQDARLAADLTLASALEVGLEPIATGPAPASSCERVDGAPGAPSIAELPFGGATLRAADGQGPTLTLTRFADPGEGLRLKWPDASTWASLRIPTDAASDHWRLETKTGLLVCPLRP